MRKVYNRGFDEIGGRVRKVYNRDLTRLVEE